MLRFSAVLEEAADQVTPRRRGKTAELTDMQGQARPHADLP
jgi:hypothetical protein